MKSIQTVAKKGASSDSFVRYGALALCPILGSVTRHGKTGRDHPATSSPLPACERIQTSLNHSIFVSPSRMAILQLMTESSFTDV
jgi:hypothetical protein